MSVFVTIQEIFFPVLAIIALPVNMVTVFILSRGKCSLSRVVTCYLVAMAVADLLVLILDLILSKIPLMYTPISVFIRSMPKGCNIHAALLYTVTDCSVWFTVAFTFDRFIAVCCQKLKTKYCTGKTAAVVLGTFRNGRWFSFRCVLKRTASGLWERISVCGEKTSIPVENHQQGEVPAPGQNCKQEEEDQESSVRVRMDTGESQRFTIDVEHSKISATVGGNASFSVQPSGEMSSGSWTFNEKTVCQWIDQLVSIDNSYTSRAELSTSTGSLLLKTVNKADSGEYQVNMVPTSGPQTSATVTLEVTEQVVPPPSGLSRGAIAGIVIGVVAGVALASGLVFWIIKTMTSR
ncbi:uncharacterized protein [Mobula birostris]|uniref:uncharacterized protein n=1 Tax=Mobula birostris TaxID=1983395 RepID=UPI003B281D63